MEVRQRHPQLYSVQSSTVLARRLLCMGNAGPGRHDVNGAGPQDGLAAKTVVVQYFPVKQPRHGLQSDVRMRRHVHRFAFGKRQWAETIEKTPRSDEASFSDG
jgi:hypothetical protein